MTNMKELTDGERVEYLSDKGKWRKGVVHGVRRVDTADGGQAVISYLVDTGGDERVDVYRHNLKDHAVKKEIKKHLGKGKKWFEAVARAEEDTKKLPDEIIEERVRQPQQVDVPPENIRRVTR